MTLEQQPPFLICVPITGGETAAGEVESLLDGLGNPAGPVIKDALDASRVIHFLSLSVVRDESKDAHHVLVADVLADGTPKTIIAALVEHAGPHLLPLFQAAAGVETLAGLERLFLRKWIKPVGASWPLWPNRATGLPFQGTPGLTVECIKTDEALALKAQTAVLDHATRGPAPAHAYLAVARKAAGIDEPKGDPFNYSDAAPFLWRAGFLQQAWTLLSLFVVDWSYVFIIMFATVSVNMMDLLTPINSYASNNSVMILTVPFSILFGIIFNAVIKFSSGIFHIRITQKRQHIIAVVTLVASLFVAGGAIYMSVRYSNIIPWARNLHISPLAWWLTSILGLISLVFFLMLVAGLLLLELWWEEKRDKPCDKDPDPVLLADIMRREDRPPHKQNHMIAVSTISPGGFRRRIWLPAGLYVASLIVRSGMFRTGFLAGIATIHCLQWTCVPGARKLVFTADYDGSLLAYLEDAIELLPGGATGIWSNTEGFPKTSWLFSAGAKDGDRFKRWVRRQMIPTRFWYSAYPHLATTDIRLNAAIRQGLHAKAMTPTQAGTWLKLFGSAPRPVSEIETDQIQGVALSGYRNLLESAVLAVSFPEDPTACRAWLDDVSHRIDFGDARQGEHAMAVALSARGVERLGLGASPPLAARFSPAFAMGMASDVHANALGDVGANAPKHWDWGGPDNPVDAVLLIYAKDQQTLQARLAAEKARLGADRPNSVAEITLRRWPPARDPTTKSLIPIVEPFGFVDGISQPAIRGLASSRGASARDVVAPGEFILGYPDGNDLFPPTPQVFVAHDWEDLLPDLPPDFPARPTAAPVRDLGRNGSYLAIRQLKQDVSGFETHVQRAAAAIGESPETVKTKMVGRWPNGAPLVLYPHGQPASYDPFAKQEDFLFGRDDPQGLACPFGAHIRRAKPRDQFDPNDETQMKITNRHRIIRRGRAYVDGDDSGADAQGLLFMCLNADIERQFEFLQQTWIGSTFFGRLRNEADPIASSNPTGTFTIPTLEGPRQVTGLPSFVSVIGGGYFFLPGRQALNFLSR